MPELPPQVLPSDAAKVVLGAAKSPSLPVSVVWCQVADRRGEFAEKLAAECDGQPVVIHVHREATRFRNLNAIDDDFGWVLRQHEEEVGRLRDKVIESRGLVMAVVSYQETPRLRVASSVPLPDWFPIAPGTRPELPVIDVSSAALVDVSSGYVDHVSIRCALHGLDCAVMKRLAHASAAGVNQDAFYKAVCECRQSAGKKGSWNQDHTWEQTLTEAQRRLSAERPEVYRPQGGNAATPTELAMRLVGDRSPRALGYAGIQLMEAMGLSPIPGPSMPPRSIVATISHLAAPERERERLVGSGILRTMHAAGSMLTVHAHPDDFAPVRIVVLVGVTRDLADSLNGFADWLEGLP